MRWYAFVRICLMNDLRNELRPDAYETRVRSRQLSARYRIVRAVHHEQRDQCPDMVHEESDPQNVDEDKYGEASPHAFEVRKRRDRANGFASGVFESRRLIRRPRKKMR